MLANLNGQDNERIDATQWAALDDPPQRSKPWFLSPLTEWVLRTFIVHTAPRYSVPCGFNLRVSL
jgi:hypothetical protein